MGAELEALSRNNTRSLIRYDPSMHVVSCEWVFRVKHKSDGSTESYKARLVPKCFQQTSGVDYFETFSPVAKQTTIRVVFTLAV